MPKQDWNQIKTIFKTKNKTYLKRVPKLKLGISSNKKQKNIFDKMYNTFLAKHPDK